ncbi:hypothetical protein FND50_25020 [Rhodococcus sp. WB9]|uniref:hypothetical protein n=1 Tax=Rhodococcus sp. WB9 TaxID=2594007 RepID=UPI001185C9C6|nr:hypothetical protein [Rhodococcus sp. WB9]QDQ93694.1 hypothetical protein FND50_25020 [Rhodococcus sp. WB9]
MAQKPWCYLDVPALTKPDLASVLVREVLDESPYLVGSCLERADYRDVDIRVLLDDERYDALFPRPGSDPLRHLIEDRLTDHYVAMTGLRVDFQIQRQSNANEKYRGVRHPLALYLHLPDEED